ncbi:MAG: acyl carrier protein [Xanthomonadales bacterium]|jgi:acyl carrier protein|nr:acyl carrier protein [Xanthomonadales bacterium]
MKSRQDIFNLIESEIKNLKDDAPALSDDTDLTSGLGLDSVQVLEMCMELEDHLDISIPINRLGEVRTAGQLADALVAIQQDAS